MEFSECDFQQPPGEYLIVDCAEVQWFLSSDARPVSRHANSA